MRSTVILAVAVALLLVVAAASGVEARRHHQHHAKATPAVGELSSQEARGTAIQLANAEFAHLHRQLDEAFKPLEKAGMQTGYTPSATPLVMLSPEVSVWSFTDSASASDTNHWSGIGMSMTGALRIDGKAYAFLGNASHFGGASMTQLNKVVMPTSTTYQFSAQGVVLSVSFSSAVDDLSSEADLARPYAYVTVSVNNTDATPHQVQLYFDIGADWTLDQHVDPKQNVQWTDLTPQDAGNWVAHSMRNYDTIPFSVKGDYVKINWGLALMAAKPDARLTHSLAGSDAMRAGFAQGKALPPVDTDGVREWSNNPVASAFQYEFGSLAPAQATGAFFLLGFDDLFSMNYFGEWQKPLWRHTFNDDVHAMILDGLSAFETLLPRLMAFDTKMFNELVAAGGDTYAALTSLVYRQVTAGIKAVWSERTQEARFYMKEISSDGDVSTVDVIYPASPFFLAFGPEVLRKMMLPLLDYGLNRTDIKYNLPWAPHHLGFWPVCDITPGQQEQMPMEESANLLLMLAAIAQQQQNSVAWLEPYWPALQTWADYLVAALPDPGNQLCTDDFEGPSPHNVNLALKGVVGLGAWSLLLQYKGDSEGAKQALSAADGFAAQWLRMAADSTGASKHTRLQYDLPGTWSQKYNMLFHSVLDLDIFDPSVMAQEVAFYKTVLAPWGLPLDSRGPLSKTDWSAWIAALSGDSEQAFQQQIWGFEWKFITTGPSKGVPFSDWYSTADGSVLGFRARPVQGGLFAKYLLTKLGRK